MSTEWRLDEVESGCDDRMKNVKDGNEWKN